MEEIIVHQFKIRKNGDYYKVLVTGSKYQAEKYMREEFHVDEIEWQKSFVTTKDIAIRLGTGNRTIANQGFFLRMEFICQMGTKRSKPLAEKPRTFEEIKALISKDNTAKFTLKEILKSQKIKNKDLAGELFISNAYFNQIVRRSVVPNEDLKEVICEYLDIPVDNIEWTGDNNEY